MKRKSLIVVSIMLLLNVSLLICKLIKPTFALDTQNDKLELAAPKEEESKELEVKTKEEAKKSTEYIDLVALDLAVNSIDMKNTNYTIPTELMQDLNNLITNYAPGCSFMIVSLEDSMTLGYNIDTSYSSGSTIKATYALYVYKLISQGKASLDDKMAYQAKYYNKGTGSIKNSAYGTEYSVKQLLYEMIHESDNVAYLMLLDKYGFDGFNEMLDDLGAAELHLSNISRWGKLSCRSSAIVWQEIYRFSKQNDYGKELLDLFINAKYNYFKEILPDVQSASKSGFTEVVVHDTGIVLDEDNKYIVIILTNTSGDMNRAYQQVKNVFSKIVPIMQNYKEFKMQK